MRMAPSDRRARHCAGQALVETLVSAGVLLLLVLAVVMLTRITTVDLAAVGASRVSAFSCALDVRTCRDGAVQEKLLGRFFGADASHVGSQFMWHDHRGHRLLAGAAAALHEMQPLPFDAVTGLLGPGRVGAAAANLLDRVAGPARFDLSIGQGLHRAQVSAPIWAGRAANGDLLTGIPLRIEARLAVLSDTWGAAGPVNGQHSVSARVERGARPLLWPRHATSALHRPTHGLMRLAHEIRLEADPAALIDFELDVDLIPPDRELP